MGIFRIPTAIFGKKIERNKLRDARDKEALKRMGWCVMTIWECQLKPAVREKTLLKIEYYLNHTFLKRFKSKVLRLYENGEYEAVSGIVAEDGTEYGKNKNPF